VYLKGLSYAEKDIIDLPMNEFLKNTLIGIRKNPNSPFVFTNRSGEPFKDIRTQFSTVLRRAGVKRIRFHDLRHTFASQLVMSGVDLNTVRELLGHADLKTTLIYAHLSQDHKKNAVNALNYQMGAKYAEKPKKMISQLLMSL